MLCVTENWFEPCVDEMQEPVNLTSVNLAGWAPHSDPAKEYGLCVTCTAVRTTQST